VYGDCNNLSFEFLFYSDVFIANNVLVIVNRR